MIKKWFIKNDLGIVVPKSFVGYLICFVGLCLLIYSSTVTNFLYSTLLILGLVTIYFIIDRSFIEDERTLLNDLKATYASFISVFILLIILTTYSSFTGNQTYCEKVQNSIICDDNISDLIYDANLGQMHVNDMNETEFILQLVPHPGSSMPLEVYLGLFFITDLLVYFGARYYYSRNN